MSDVICWWGHQALRYPTLMRMACDYLAIQGSATLSECAFSSGRIMDTAHHNCLSPKLFEALQMLKSAYHNGHIKASHQAAQHVDVLIALQEELETQTDGELEDSLAYCSLCRNIYFSRKMFSSEFEPYLNQNQTPLSMN